jgi:type II secretion system protein I
VFRNTFHELNGDAQSWEGEAPAKVVPRSPARGTRKTAGLQEPKETFGRASGPVGRPVHNRCSGSCKTSETSEFLRIPLRRDSRRRRGLTLFELLLALAIFLGSVAALAHLINTGSQAAVQGRLQTRAILRCESKMAEILAGVESMQSARNVPFSDDRNWKWNLDVREGPLPGLLELTLAVSHTGNGPLSNTSYALNRYVRHPAWFQSRAAETAVVDDVESDPGPAAAPDENPSTGDGDR